MLEIGAKFKISAMPLQILPPLSPDPLPPWLCSRTTSPGPFASPFLLGSVRGKSSFLLAEKRPKPANASPDTVPLSLPLIEGTALFRLWFQMDPSSLPPRTKGDRPRLIQYCPVDTSGTNSSHAFYRHSWHHFNFGVPSAFRLNLKSSNLTLQMENPNLRIVRWRARGNIAA